MRMPGVSGHADTRLGGIRGCEVLLGSSGAQPWSGCFCCVYSEVLLQGCPFRPWPSGEGSPSGCATRSFVGYAALKPSSLGRVQSRAGGASLTYRTFSQEATCALRPLRAPFIPYSSRQAKSAATAYEVALLNMRGGRMRKKGPVSVILVMAMLVVANLTFHPLASASPSDALLDDEAPIDVFLEGDRPLQEMRENAEGESVRSSLAPLKPPDDTRSADLRAPAAWADGRIKVTVSTVNLGKTRNDWQYPRAGVPAWITCPSYNAGGVELLDSNSALVGSFSGASAYEFVGLEEGTYTLKLTYDPDALVVLKNIVNGSDPMQNIVRDAVIQIVVTQEKPTHTYHVVYEPKAYGFKTTTAIGTFQSGGNKRVYYKGENLQVPNTDPVSSSYAPFLNSHNGIYYGDSPNQYTGMNTLEIPMLSDSEKKKRILFCGMEAERGYEWQGLFHG